MKLMGQPKCSPFARDKLCPLTGDIHNKTPSAKPPNLKTKMRSPRQGRAKRKMGKQGCMIRKMSGADRSRDKRKKG
uniref:Uncharacterized protein n=1 Tax=Nymphaea colorata TaxID=210225 RepID=A0A5K1E9K3_9MAGN